MSNIDGPKQSVHINNFDDQCRTPTYTIIIGKTGRVIGIECLRCAFTSNDLNDAKGHYCPNCHAYHQTWRNN